MRLGLHYPTRQLVEQNHDTLVTMYGGSLGVRDENLLESALARPLNVLLYSDHATADLFDAAAAFAYGIRRNHPFVDGNKRASWLTAQAFLAGNGVEIAADPTEAVTCMVKLAYGQMSEGQLAAWLRGKAQADASAPE